MLKKFPYHLKNETLYPDRPIGKVETSRLNAVGISKLRDFLDVHGRIPLELEPCIWAINRFNAEGLPFYVLDPFFGIANKDSELPEALQFESSDFDFHL